MDVAYISALSALTGSVVGGLTSTGMTWLTQRAQARSGQLAHEFERREDLFRDSSSRPRKPMAMRSSTVSRSSLSSLPSIP